MQFNSQDKSRAAAAIDGLREELFALSRRIHENPELRFEEDDTFATGERIDALIERIHEDGDDDA